MARGSTFVHGSVCWLQSKRNGAFFDVSSKEKYSLLRFGAILVHIEKSILKYISLALFGLCNASPPTVLPLES